MLHGTTVIDADGHLNDWHLDWEALLPPELHGVAPKSVRDKNGFPHLEVEGRLLPGGEWPEIDLAEMWEQSTRDKKYWVPNRPGETHPELRLPDMDEMGIDVAVLFGGHCFLVASKVANPEVATATLRAYNNYLAEYCATAPDRLKGVAMVPIQAPEAAADELRRAVNDLGLVAAVVPPHHENGTTLDDPRLDHLWTAAQDLGVPVCVHTIGAQISPIEKFLHPPLMDEAYGSIPSMLALGHLILGGVLDRFPALTFAFLEAGAGWVPYFMDRMQESSEMFGRKDRQLKKTPEEYVRSEQLYYATDPDEPLLPAVAQLVGEERLVIGSDYCHPEGMCPFTMSNLAERDDLSDGLKRKILHDNPARLYGL